MKVVLACQNLIFRQLFSFCHTSLFFIFFIFNSSVLYNSTNIDAVAKISFLINLLCLFWGGWKIFFEKHLSIMDSVFVTFFYAFFWLAPIIQLNQGSFPYYSESDPLLIATTNAIMILFFISYFGSKSLFKKRIHSLIHKMGGQDESVDKNDGIILVIYIIVSTVIAFLFSKALLSYLYSGVGIIPSDAEGQIIRKFIFYIPTFPLYYLMLKERQKGNSKIFFLLLLFYSLFLFFLFKNPLNEKRNAIGPLYLSVLSIFLFYKGKVTNRLYIGSLLLVFILAFPVISSVTHSKISVYETVPALTNRILDNQIQTSLTTGDFDSWSMMLAVNAYCKENGFSYGKQLLGNILFFVPRKYWPSKSYGSGHYIVENYLSKNYSWYFTNVSCPFPGEGYINFGILGTFLFGIVLGILGLYTDHYLFSSNLLKRLFAHFVPFSTVMLLRGDLNSGFAYLITPLLAIYYIPRFFRYSLSKLANITALKKR